MLTDLEDAKKMDLILSYLTRNITARVKYKQIMDLLSVDLDKARYLHKSILKYHHESEPIISIHNAMNIAEKPNYTEEFLKKGGFAARYRQQAQNETIEENDMHKIGKSGLNNRLVWFTFCIAIMALIFSLFALLISLKIIKTE